jgi:Photosynthetic reaction centre cytochrome C subunit
VRRLLTVIVLPSTVLGLAFLGARLISGSSPLAGASSQSESLSTQEFNDRLTARLKQGLGAREAEPASAVFKNITIDWLKDVPAGNFLGIMNGGYAKALGVRCTHCHMEDDFASDDLRPKRAAREMAVMHHGINQQLGRMKHLEDAPQERFINCATCHRGRIDPRDPPAR